ncbi:helix-hairpin-helix domain-containing protein [cf. Phormidesmis sp. LEGE 11477]|uniref:helix-hairpin-helix domain-containing protein n=1 Tax=cf. Phormidesmis sp. LEGE 11477 TaxID=1828680 RepID=UPI00187F8064|nr:helix-hairpin-helix domain-containing protein [cf. Phormidesmis sp. LEGE 11477]MBE9061224.1 DNA-binding protein [cf. Phormidesmis sp. LEGE 11477]
MIQTTLFPDTFRQVFSLSNDEIAIAFEQVADLLETQGDDYYRIRAYRKGAQSVRAQAQPVVDIFETEGVAGLEQLSYIGKRLAASIKELAQTGELSLLARLQAETSPELFTKIPGIGPVLANRIHKELDIDSLEALEQAAYDGSLAQLSGFGEGRTMLIRDSVGAMLDRAAARQLQEARAKAMLPSRSSPSVAQRLRGSINRRQKTLAQTVDSPSIELLLEVDAQYRYLAKAGQLRMIAPRRFNPDGEPWLPIMRLQKEGWSFNVLYSNTARAHELDKTHDWVVVYYEKVGKKASQRGQCTIVTETQGMREGDRVVRGELAAAS